MAIEASQLASAILGVLEDLQEAAEEAKEQAPLQAMTQVAQNILDADVIPYDTGALEQSQAVVQDSAGEAHLEYGVEYFENVFYATGVNFQTDVNPNARARWTEEFLDESNEKSAQATSAAVTKAVLEKYIEITCENCNKANM